MQVFELILCILAAVIVSSFISRFIPRVSTPLVQIVLGLVAAYLPFFPDVKLNPELFMVLFIAPLLYEEAHSIDKSALLRHLKLSLSLAIGLAAATMIAVGFALSLAWPAVPLAAALALGAALGPTDAVAVSALGREASLSMRQTAVLKGESLFNDATGIVGFQFAIAAAATGMFKFGEALGDFVLSFTGGTVLGLAIGMIVNWLFETMRRLGWENTTTRILMEIFLPFLMYMSAEMLHVSGILCVVASGLIGRFDRTGVGPNVARANIVSSSVWSVIAFSLNGTVFILLGMQLPGAMHTSWEDPTISNWTLIGLILLVTFVVVGMRFVWVLGMLRLTKDTDTGKRRPITRERLRSAAVMTLGGPKGTITLSLMFTIPYWIEYGDEFPMRNDLIFIASGVIILTLVMANFGLPLLAPNRHKDYSAEHNKITIEVLRRTIEELGAKTTPENRRAMQMVVNSYTQRITRLQQRLGGPDSHDLDRLQAQALKWEHDYIDQQLKRIKAHEPSPDGEEEIAEEACDLLLERISQALEHLGSIDETESRAHVAWRHIHRRFSSMTRRAHSLAKRAENRVRHTAPMMSDDELFAHTRRLQVAAIDHTINKLYGELGSSRFKTENVSGMILDYQRAKAALQARPNVGYSARAQNMAEEIKKESYAIELRIIQDMADDGEISRAEARNLRRNVYVMQVDADSGL
ncbi:Na+/H+ antiporter [Bifidobacterium vespertilionis]|uniref:Na+/H+ antiporter n=1 Tax=Bifidobacterium vespertilionis TaxID=2562524 RepID=A0A5J5E3F0_9BIFI|nr:Na+/H+ antiporter [Bifidobacterium vespertilionis]KAA8821105.1 Na+/H+ antiporter [Bifidobacterium vespertilionis]KAA8823663.1 Na+/H+ antiporter [Bifidobacterium vespertilionis]MBT1178893.1 Na+/H+ antiporter [Bifidobacterium vespertilionis]